MCKHHLHATKTQEERCYSYDAEARLLTIVVSGVASAYVVVPTDDGGHRLIAEGREGVVYDVLLGAEAKYDVCTCPSGRYRGRCKHVDALRDMTTRQSS